jgi:acyl-CoA thioesterase
VPRPETGSCSFAEASAVAPRGGGRYAAEIEESWRGGAGAHGGFIAGLVLRAIVAEVDDPERAPRSLSMHYVSPPAAGPCEMVVRVERAGRSLSTLSARLEQEGELRALALAACSRAWDAPGYAGDTAPEAPAAESVEVLELGPSTGAPNFFSHVEVRPTVGGFTGSGSPRVGGWMRTRPPAAIDAPAAALLLDAWWPAVFALVPRPVGAPTIDLTIHFRRALPATGPDDAVFALFSTRQVHDGFFEEDGELWSASGELLAQSRQLALLRGPV